jgi:hypothetical protein
MRAAAVGITASAVAVIIACVCVVAYWWVRAAHADAFLSGAPITFGPGSAIPLTFTGNNYTVAFTAGASRVTAIMDTGSARCVLATASCGGGCAGPTYQPGSAATPLVDPTTQTPCTSTLDYVSQTDTVRMYSDTVTFPRVVVNTGCVSSSAAATPLTITDFPIGGVTTASGSGSSLNVLGLSAVQIGGGARAPSCQTVASPTYLSAIIQTLATYYTGLNLDVVFSYDLGRNLLMFAGLDAGPCAAPAVARVPLVRALPDPPADGIADTPMRYYVVGLVGVTVNGRPVPGPLPKYLILDTGTTQVQLPDAPGAVAALTGMSASDVAVFTVGSGSETATLTYKGSGAAEFAAMPAAAAAAFSTSKTVGILGCTGMRTAAFEFNLTRFTAGIVGR